MKKTLNIILSALGALTLASCADLDLNPLSAASSENWYSSPEEVKISLNDFYRSEFFPIEHGYAMDRQTDDWNQRLVSYPVSSGLIDATTTKGQVNIALTVLEELGLSIPVCGMVKDDHHRTRGLYFQNKEIPIARDSEGFKLITRIQDEAHRFAIEYHRSLRSKSQVHSILDDIPGIGATRRKALMKYFDSIEEVRNASEETLAGIDSMDARSARSVYEFFHKEDQEEDLQNSSSKEAPDC